MNKYLKNPILLIFGITGDLAQTKLLPAISTLVKSRKTKGLKVIGLSRRPLEKPVDLPDFEHIQTDFQDERVFAELAKLPNKIYYLALPPEAYEAIIKKIVPSRGDKILIEKPYGQDLRQAKKIHQLLLKKFKEKQIFRVDHYLGKESVQKLGKLKLDPKKIEKIEINFSESASVAHRARFFDQTGAFRDVGQNHLLQVLAKIIGKNNLAKLELANDPSDQRGQYGKYKEEIGHDSETETLFRLTARVKTGKWHNVPLVLANGKGMPINKNEVIIHFRGGKEQKYKLTNGGYEKVLLSAIKNSREIFPTESEIEAQWSFTEKALKRLRALPLKTY